MMRVLGHGSGTGGPRRLKPAGIPARISKFGKIPLRAQRAIWQSCHSEVTVSGLCWPAGTEPWRDSRRQMMPFVSVPATPAVEPMTDKLTAGWCVKETSHELQRGITTILTQNCSALLIAFVCNRIEVKSPQEKKEHCGEPT
jgi:hypothetical protein